MNKRAKLLAAAAAVLAVGLVVWAVYSVPEAPPIQQKPEKRTMSYDGNTISEEKNGRLLWEITAEHIDVDVDTQDTTMTGITGHFYAEDGRVADLSADSGVYGGKSKDISLTGNIKLSNSDGAKMSCDSMKWQAKEEVLTAIGKVRAVKDDILLTADQVESGDGFNKVKATGHAHIARDKAKAAEMAAELDKADAKQSGGKGNEAE